MGGVTANLEHGTTSTRRLHNTLFFPGKVSSSRFRLPPTSNLNSPSNFAFLSSRPLSSQSSIALFPSTCGSATWGIGFCWLKSRPRGDRELIVGLRAASAGLATARFKTILIVFGLEATGAGIGAGGDGGVAERGGGRRTLVGGSGAAIAGASVAAGDAASSAGASAGAGATSIAAGGIGGPEFSSATVLA